MKLFVQGVRCHSIVLCLMPTFKQLLLEQDDEKDLFFPDLSHRCLAQFLNDIYAGLCLGENFELKFNQDLAEVLGMFDGNTFKTEDEIKWVDLIMNLKIVIN